MVHLGSELTGKKHHMDGLIGEGVTGTSVSIPQVAHTVVSTIQCDAYV